ncbi:uncharacterized protein VTP21DRAFT_5776 [Calcarisporiella thermophila]|uniref:uncharacterized protein n=1 Tax=Calcarisporiella thermophila TaxID=911321 RepID=UPI0037448A3B
MSEKESNHTALITSNFHESENQRPRLSSAPDVLALSPLNSRTEASTSDNSMPPPGYLPRRKQPIILPYAPLPNSWRQYVARNRLRSRSMDSRMEEKGGELVQYNEWRIILRHDLSGQIVLYHPQNREIAIRRVPRQYKSITAYSNVCMLCRRPFLTEQNANPSYMDANYFRLLADCPRPSSSISSENTSSKPALHSTSYPSTARESMCTSISDNVSPHSVESSHLSNSAFNQGYYERFFVEERKLGRGLRGSVFLCQHILDNVYLGEYAIKKVAVGDNHVWLTRMLKEVHLLERLHHPNIIDYKHAWLEEHRLTPFGPMIPCLFILMECANGGNLEEYIEVVEPTSNSQEQDFSHMTQRERALHAKRQRILRQQPTLTVRKRYLPLEEIWAFFLDIVNGLRHLHHHGIVHRDLKPPNLLLSYETNTTRENRLPRVLLSDFGECEVLEASEERDRTGATGTLEFMAPELITVDENGRYLKDYSPKADMWSLGMLLYYLCYSQLPYQQVADVDLLKEEILGFNSVPNFPDMQRNGANINTTENSVEEIPPLFKHLILALLRRDPSARPSCDEILGMLGNADLHLSPFELPNIMTKDMQKDGFGIKLSPISRNEIEREVDEDGAHISKIASSASLASGTGISIVGSPQVESERFESAKTKEIEGDVADDPGMRKRKHNASDADDQIHRQEKKWSSHQSVPVINPQLPPPPNTRGFWTRIDQEPEILQRIIKMAFMMLKVLTCVAPCHPYLPSMEVLYPVLGMAALDLLTRSRRTSAILVFLHLGWIGLIVMSRRRFCCEEPRGLLISN